MTKSTIPPEKLREGHAYCRCKARQFRADLHIQFCPDCAPNKPLSIYREEERRSVNPELPFTPAAQPQRRTPQELRDQAKAIREAAEYADHGPTRRREIRVAEELERHAAQLEQTQTSAAA